MGIANDWPTWKTKIVSVFFILKYSHKTYSDDISIGYWFSKPRDKPPAKEPLPRSVKPVQALRHGRSHFHETTFATCLPGLAMTEKASLRGTKQSVLGSAFDVLNYIRNFNWHHILFRLFFFLPLNTNRKIHQGMCAWRRGRIKKTKKKSRPKKASPLLSNAPPLLLVILFLFIGTHESSILVMPAH